MRFQALLSYHENFVVCVKVKEFQFEDTATNRKLSNNTLVEEVKLILMEKYESELDIYQN